MKKKARNPSDRARRRAADRGLAKQLDEREQLFRLSSGGSPAHPISVSTASLVEASARQLPCPQCGGAQRVLEHLAKSLGENRVRQVELVCTQCGTRRSAYVRIEPALPN